MGSRHLLRVAGLAAVDALFRQAPDRLMRLFYEERRARDIGRICSYMAEQHRPYRLVDAPELSRIAGTNVHGGVVAVAEPQPEYALTVAAARQWAGQGQSLFVLDGIGNPHNLGAIARSLAFFGWGRLVLTDHPLQAGLSDAAYRIAEGGLDYLKLYRARDLAALLKQIRTDYRVVGTALGEAGLSLPEIQQENSRRPCLVILGNEEEGLPKSTLDACDRILTLKGAGEIQSLNVSATAAILAHALAEPAKRLTKSSPAR